MSLIPALDDFRVPFEKGQRTERPLPPPGHPYDGRAHEDDSALYPAEQQVTTITLGTTTAEGDVTTLVVTPILTAQGSPWADNLIPYTFEFTTPANPDDTLAKVTEGIALAAAAQQQVVSLEDLGDFARVEDFMTVANNGDDIVITTRDAGATFTAVLTSTGAITSAQVTTGTNADLLRVGIFGVQTAINVDGTKEIGASGSDLVLGLIMYSINVRPRDAGDLFDSYVRRQDVIFVEWGTGTALAEGGVTVDAAVYRRTTAGAGETLGAVTDTPVTVQQITTGVPTVANDTLYRLELTVTDLFTGALKASGVVSFTSDASATAAEIVDGMIINIAAQAAAVDALIATANVADELEITANGGCVLAVLDLDANFPFTASQAASSEHALVPGAKFLQTTTAAGSAPIFLSHP